MQGNLTVFIIITSICYLTNGFVCARWMYRISKPIYENTQNNDCPIVFSIFSIPLWPLFITVYLLYTNIIVHFISVFQYFVINQNLPKKEEIIEPTKGKSNYYSSVIIETYGIISPPLETKLNKINASVTSSISSRHYLICIPEANLIDLYNMNGFIVRSYVNFPLYQLKKAIN